MSNDHGGPPGDRSSPAAELAAMVWAEHGPSMLAYATRLTTDRDVAEDLVQEALVRAWRRPDSVTNERGSLRGWLLTIVRNLAVDRHRALRSRPLEVAESPGTTPWEPDHADAVVARVIVRDALGRVSPGQRAVLHHLYIEGRSVAETSQLLSLPVGTVKSRSHYALRSLRTIVSGDGADLNLVA